MSEIAARLKTNKIRRKQKKIFQNYYSTEFIICTLRKQRKKTPYETSHSVMSLNLIQDGMSLNPIQDWSFRGVSRMEGGGGGGGVQKGHSS